MWAVDWFLALCAGMSGKSARGRWATIGVAIVLTGVAGYGITLVRVHHDVLSWVPPGTPIREAFETVDDTLGGSANIQLLITAKTERGMKDERILSGIERLETRVKDFVHPKTKTKIVSNVRSIIDVLREIRRALNGGGAEEYRLPEGPEKTGQYFGFVETQAPDDLGRMMTLDAKIAQVTIGLKWLDATSYIPLTDEIEKAVAEEIPEELAHVSLTGTVYTLLSTEGLLLLDMLRSFGVALLVISFIMLGLLKDWKLGLIAMVPNLLPIAYIVGLMGLFSVPVDMMNLMLASIALGIAVDDTIHLLHHFKVQHALTGDVELSIRIALRDTGRALVITSVILALGFFVYMMSDINGLQRFGSLIGVTVIIAVVIDLVVTPALLRLAYKTEPRAATK